MIQVFLMMAGLWALARWGLRSKALEIVLPLIVLIGVITLHVTLPDGHPLREATGDNARDWIVLLVVLALFYGYRWGLAKLRARAAPVAQSTQPEGPSGPFAPGELNRYARHIVLRELGGPGQKRLKEARVLVIGAGGLGSPALQYLAAAGVGTIGVIDDDLVDAGNLQRQVIHRDEDIDTPKVFSAERAMKSINPFLTVHPYQRRLTPEIAHELFADYDVILDGTDNFTTRYLANETAVALGLPLVSGALSQWEGQLSVFDPAQGAPCYQCIFPEAPAAGLAPSCAEAGVLGPLPGVVGAMMAAETVKLITGAGQPLRGEMMIYDALWGETRKIGLKPRGDCPVCAAKQSAD